MIKYQSNPNVTQNKQSKRGKIMSDQEVGAMMDAAANNETVPVAAEAEAAPTVTTDIPENTAVNVTDCTKVYDFVNGHADIINNWKKVNLSLVDGTAIADTKEVLIGVDNDGIPFSFNAKNLMIPTELLNGITAIKMYVSGIIMESPTSTIYIAKNNIFVYNKNAEGRTTDSKTYYKVRGDKVGYKVNEVQVQEPTVEACKLVFKVNGSRIYNLVEKLTDVNEMRNTIITFLKTKVVDLNYCIKIENLMQQLQF